MEEIITDHKMAEVHVCPLMILGKPGTLKVDFCVELISGFHMTSCNRMLESKLLFCVGVGGGGGQGVFFKLQLN